MVAAARLHARVRGHVQGVGFRYFVQRTGQQLGLAGYARNEPSGDALEVFAEGSRQSLTRLLEQLHKGPPASVVLDIEVEWQEATGEFEQFLIRR